MAGFKVYKMIGICEVCFDSVSDETKKGLRITEEQHEALFTLIFLTRVKRGGRGGGALITTQNTYFRMTRSLAKAYRISLNNESTCCATEASNPGLGSRGVFPGVARKLD